MSTALLPLLEMRLTGYARQQIDTLLKFGVAQKIIAARMGVSESTFSRWYRGQPDSKGKPAKIPAEALDLLEIYVEEMIRALEQQRAVLQTELDQGSPVRVDDIKGENARGAHVKTGSSH